MNMTLKALLASASLFGALAAQAQALPADAPAGTTVQCNDNSYAAPDLKSGACQGHKGIKTWYGKTAAVTPAASPTAVKPVAATSAPAAATAPAMPSNTPATTSKAASANKAPDVSTMVAAPGGGAGKVWGNDASKVYHCMGDLYYGKTKKGEYLSETDAKAKGMHAAHGKVCS